MENCVFCKIIKGEIPSNKVYEDEEILAFKDINPAAPIHILVIPKKHIASLVDMKEGDEILISKIYTVINKIAQDIGIDKKSYRAIVNCGENGCKKVTHLHFHLLAGKKRRKKIV